MLAPSEMMVVLMLDEKINPGRYLTAELIPKSNHGKDPEKCHSDEVFRET
jgi:hypothetical protein